MGEEQFLDALGPKIVAGREFTPDEFVEWTEFNAPDSNVSIPSVIITRSMADKLFPGQSAVGKSLYSWGNNPIRVVGVVDHLVRPSDQGGPAAHERSEEHTSELQSLMRISYAVFCLQKKNNTF